MQEKNAVRALRMLLSTILLSFPTALLILPVGRRINFYALLLCAFACMIYRIKPGGLTFWEALKKYWPMHLAMAAMLIGVLLQQLVHGEFAFKPIEKALEFAVFPLFMWTLLLLSGRQLRILQWAWIVGAALSSVALYVAMHGGEIRALGVISNPLIPFSDLTVLLGFLALISIGWDERGKEWLTALKILTWCATLYASYISGTRGGWIAIPFYIIIAILVLGKFTMRQKALASLAAMAVIAATMATLPYTRSRMELAYSEVVKYQESNETSVGVRLQLWQVSWNIFRDHPILGIGAAGYGQELKRLAAIRSLSPEAGSSLHAHSDFMQALATLGAIGVIAIFALYAVPGICFMKLARKADGKQRATAGMGLAVSAGFLVYGLTDTLFYWSVCSQFYTIIIAALFALLIKGYEDRSISAASGAHPQVP